MKMRDMKKGGYTLFSNKTRKMLLAVGLSMLSVCTMSIFSYAAPTIEGQFKKVDENKTIYQVKLSESEENLPLSLYSQKGEGELVPVEPVIWQEKEDEILAIVEINNDEADTLIVKNNAQEPQSAQLSLASEIRTDNDGPVVKWAYKNEEEKYIQFEAEDLTNVYKVVDEDDVERVKIDEKEQDNVVTVKYMLEDNDKKFYLYDILGNRTEVVIEDIGTTYTIAAKNTDGKKIVLNMALPQGAVLKSIETVKGEDIITKQGVTKESKGANDDSLVAIYSGVTEGTTYLNVKYTLNNKEEEIRVLLDLDLEAPVLVKRNSLGNVVEDNGTARAYKSVAGDKAIVEVKDMVSGITKIVACVETHESEEPNQKFEISNLPKSVLQLIDLPEGATCIRVYDGIGNVREIDLEQDLVEDSGKSINLDMVLGEENAVIATFSDKKAGLEKFVRAKKDMAKSKTIQDETCEKNYAPQNAYDSLKTTSDINNYYKVTEEQIILQESQLQGTPEFTAVDVFGNVKEFNMNEILFDADSVLMATSGKDEETVVKAIVVKLKDVRRIKKITATIDGEETILETFETDLTNIGQGPTEIDKAYEMPDNAHVSKITVYHSNDERITQNEIDVDFTVEPSEDSPIIQIPEAPAPGEEGGEVGEEVGEGGEEPGEDPRKDFVEIIGGEMIEGDEVPVLTRIKYGIKKINYSDGCVIEFSEDLPKEVEVYTRDKAGNPLESVIITDGLGYTYNVADGSGDIAKYAPEGLEGGN